MSISAPWWVQISASIALFYIILLGALLLAFAKGGAPERRGALVVLAMASWQYPANFVSPPNFVTTDAISLISDCIGLVGFGLIALNARRLWPIWASAFQLLSISGHFARWVDLAFDPIIYSWMKSLPTAGAILALLIGTLAHIRRRARTGADPSWQDWRMIERNASIRRHLRSSRR
jgi:hypothetical protein